jgi:sialic acid synthase SpsE
MFVVGEIGVNWDGDFELVKQMMYELKTLQLNAVKFQAFTFEMVKNHPESKRLMSSSITKENVEKINEISQETGIDWFCTPMYSEAVDFLDPFISRYKIREFDGRQIIQNDETDLFQAIYKKNKNIFISSETVPLDCSLYNDSRIKWIYCVPKYPCNFDEIDFSLLKHFDGFSNHCSLIEAPIRALREGIEILEIHITSDKTKDFVDNNVSFDYDEIKEIMKVAKVINS